MWRLPLIPFTAGALTLHTFKGESVVEEASGAHFIALTDSGTVPRMARAPSTSAKTNDAPVAAKKQSAKSGCFLHGFLWCWLSSEARCWDYGSYPCVVLAVQCSVLCAFAVLYAGAVCVSSPILHVTVLCSPILHVTVLCALAVQYCMLLCCVRSALWRCCSFAFGRHCRCCYEEKPP